MLGTLVFFSITFFVVFDTLWAFFGGIYVFWMLLMFGVSQIIIDFFFISPQAGQEMQNPVDSGRDIAQRQQQVAGMQRNFAQGFMRGKK